MSANKAGPAGAASGQPQQQGQQGQPTASSGGSGSGSGSGGGGGGGGGSSDHTSIVLEYLIKRGYHGAAQALRSEIDGGASAAGKTVTQDGFERKSQGKTGHRREDPMPWRDGLLGLRDFVYGSLDIHRPELLPILLPVYVHSVLDLVLLGYRDQAEIIYQSLVADYESLNPGIVSLLSSLKTPAQIVESEQANRWRRERYIVKMTRRGWSLLLGWLQGGTSNLGTTSSQGDIAERGREKMLGIINERVRVDVVNQKGVAGAGATAGLSDRLLGAKSMQGGLESELQVDTSHKVTPAQDKQQQQQQGPTELKLGPMPTDPRLEKEVQRALQTEGLADSAAQTVAARTNGDTVMSDGTAAAGLTPVHQSDLPPYPPSFRTVDVQREVEKVREARRRIKLGQLSDAEAAKKAAGILTRSASQAKYNLPSVCMFTLHDTTDTLVSSEFSDDSSLLACGFSESYIRLWNLRGDPLRAVTSDFDSTFITSSTSLYSNHRESESEASYTRKLVGHSGPVYSLSFDPIPGPSGPPRYLLSSSQDATVRLWSMDTFSNIVAYRGHRDPVWDVEWGPRGVYFATASRDRTARLWTTERVAAVRIFAGHLSDVETVKFHPNSLYLATGSADRTCRLWDVQKGTCVRVFVGHSAPVSTIAMSPDGRFLASAGDDYAINLWDLGSSRLIKTMAGHTSRIHSLSFSAESSILVSGSSDCTMRAWDVASSQQTALSVNGVPQSASANEGALVGMKDSRQRVGEDESPDLLLTLPTKRTPVFTTKFTPRNLCLAAGPIF